jgi:3-methyladenine DNA glycosylase AlkC
MSILKIPAAPNAIQKGSPLKMILDKAAVNQLGKNLQAVDAAFEKEAFVKNTLKEINQLSITQRSKHIAQSLKIYLPNNYSEAIEIILKSLSPPLNKTEGNGLAPLFYMPHCSYIAEYGVDPIFNKGMDPFNASMHAQYELTKRFTCEFSIRSFIANDEARTMRTLHQWMKDANPHVRRLCSEGTRPRLPWSTKIDSFVKDPRPSLSILDALKNDPDLYVRRSVANHIGDIAKDHIELALELCEKWLIGASKELKWLIRHALRNPAKKGNLKALELRKNAL